MRVKLRILGIPRLSQIVGKGDCIFEFEGQTVGNLVEALIDLYGEKVKTELLDSEGKLSRKIKVSINRQAFLASYPDDVIINHGDEVTLMILLAGG